MVERDEGRGFASSLRTENSIPPKTVCSFQQLWRDPTCTTIVCFYKIIPIFLSKNRDHFAFADIPVILSPFFRGRPSQICIAGSSALYTLCLIIGEPAGGRAGNAVLSNKVMWTGFAECGCGLNSGCLRFGRKCGRRRNNRSVNSFPRRRWLR